LRDHENSHAKELGLLHKSNELPFKGIIRFVLSKDILWYSFESKDRKTLTFVLAKGRVSQKNIGNIRNPGRN